jgi:hypothetical protein
MSEFKRKFPDVSVQRMTIYKQAHVRLLKRPFPVWIDRERKRDRESPQKARGKFIHLRRFEFLRLDVGLQYPNTPQILKLPKILWEVLKQIHLLRNFPRTAITGNHFYSICVKEYPVNKAINISDEHVTKYKNLS